MEKLASGPAVMSTTVGWAPTCSCESEVVPCTVLDPFCGSGRAGMAALREGRHFIGIDLKPEYCEMARAAMAGEAARAQL